MYKRQVEDHQDHTVVSAQVQGIVVIAQLLLESLAGCHQIVQRLGDLGNASLVKGGHVPEEDTAGHGDRHALLRLSLIHILGGGCPYNVSNRIEGAGVYTVTRTPLQLSLIHI